MLAGGRRQRSEAIVPQPVAFQATSETLIQLLPAGQGFYVPVYQRSYTWGAAQIDRLFEDISAGMNRTAKSPGPPTFLGSMILYEGRSSVSPRVNTFRRSSGRGGGDAGTREGRFRGQCR